ncbi:general transcription factor II-I repeat domain-containing protein 2-like [Andrena cerasifolii]|uniref:general transcription factor II-I repeat domain-containing protein 2-like n=1 Tax=Andrena cerasifolii TaxID=2819439 RepID=UPI0040384BDD
MKQLKKYNIQRHYTGSHSKDYVHLSPEERLEEIETLKAALIVADEESQNEEEGPINDAALRSSYIVALELAKTYQPFTSGQLFKELLLEVVHEVSSTQVNKYKCINLSRMTILRRVEEMANNVADRLRNVASNFVSYSLALDESTDISGTPQLAIFIRGVDENLVVTEELLDFLPFKESTTGEDIFSCVEEVIERGNLQWDKLVSVTTDGTPAMAGRFIGLVGRIQSKVKNLAIPREIIAIHCLIHQEHLCAKRVELSDVMAVVVQTTKFIRHNGSKRRPPTDSSHNSFSKIRISLRRK